MACAAQAAAQGVVDTYADVLSAAYTGHMAAKLGLLEYHKPLAVGLVTLMQEDKADFTNTFRCCCRPMEFPLLINVPAACMRSSFTPNERAIDASLWEQCCKLNSWCLTVPQGAGECRRGGRARQHTTGPGGGALPSSHAEQ